MNKRGHVENAGLLALTVALLMADFDLARMPVALAEFGIPIIIGALFPDIDVTFGKHRATFHNLLVLGGFVAFPIVFENLYFVWIGVLTHYVLDLLGNVQGMALLYPYPAFYDIPVGVPVNSRWTDIVTVLVTGFEVVILYVYIEVVGAPLRITSIMGGVGLIGL